MINKALDDYTREDLLSILDETVDAIVLVDSKQNRYRTIARKGIFSTLISDTGVYEDLIQKIWFHLENSNDTINDDYKAFVSYYREFKGKYSRRAKVFVEGDSIPHYIQMNVYPIDGTGQYVFAMDELANEEYVEEYSTNRKVNTIQNTYLFSMYVDLLKDTTSSISVTEISDDTMNATIKYSQWRLMAVNMIWPDDQKQFMSITDPEYLKENLSTGRTTSFDCKMKNLEGVYIWVKLVFIRAETTEEEFRFVFMVQNIDENVKELMSTMKKYESLALRDPLTGLFNRGGIETEINNAIELFKKGGSDVSLMMIDLDYFKNVNDTFGHAAGDEALKHFAEVLRKSAEGKSASVGRWGGEEFVILLRNMSEDKAASFAENLRKNVEDASFGEVGRLTCSIGLSHLKKEDTFDNIFRRIDRAMYASKNAGRNRVTKE
ncbi:GGDEF domain-containing protein [Butyrivibrio sp. XPD2006]|uniref:GGDEF domain-containing protein n=1 Tax=Butyrivibrio sp. XPD2006 TaxID=1280668 RepID=UPI0003B3239A|nr:GGDEF domain-containing protein [Butyrivibrio sp. XPD2006]